MLCSDLQIDIQQKWGAPAWGGVSLPVGTPRVAI